MILCIIDTTSVFAVTSVSRCLCLFMFAWVLDELSELTVATVSRLFSLILFACVRNELGKYVNVRVGFSIVIFAYDCMCH